MNRLVNANISKRLGAFLLDAFMVIILGTLLYSGFAQIFIRTPAFSEATKIMNEILVETHLYEYDEEDPNVVVIVEEKEYDASIEKYYLDYLKDEEAYHSKMKESDLFNFVDGDYVKKDSVKDEEVKTFYEEVLTDAIVKVKNSEEYLFCYQVSMNYVFYNFFLSFLLSYMCFIVLIPCVLKRRVTIGQRIMNMALVKGDSDEFVSKTQVIFRGFIILLIEGVVSFIALGLPIIISALFIVFRKDNSSYHDLLSYSRLIDYHYIELDDGIKR